MAVKVGINGFGRIGRNIYRAAMGDAGVDIVAVNDITDPRTLAHLLKYDSVLGNLDATVQSKEDSIQVGGHSIRVFKVRDPAELDWKSVGAEIVVESTGLFTKGPLAAKHLRDTVKKVIISAPATDPDHTLVLGVNDNTYDPGKHHIVSNASCTTTCLAPVVKVLNDTLGIVHGTMTTVHSYTNDQRLLDLPHKDLRRARSAVLSMIPTSTGAAKALHQHRCGQGPAPGHPRVEGQARRFCAARAHAQRLGGGPDRDGPEKDHRGSGAPVFSASRRRPLERYPRLQ